MPKKIKVSTNKNPRQKLFTPQVFLIIMIVIVLFFVLFIHNQRLSKKSEQYAKQIEQLDQQIKEANQEAKDLKEQEEYQKTDEFKEKVARTQLGMIKSTEKIFKAAE